MFENDLSELSTADLLESAAEHRVMANRADARLLQHAQIYADRFHPSTCDVRRGRRSGDGRERAVVLGGEGCPEITEFAIAEFGVVLGISPMVAARFLGEALALRHRFPFTWARVLAGDATPWKARQLASLCMKLSEEAARYVDQRVAPLIDSITPYRLDKIIRAAKFHADPELARAEAAEAARERGVFVGRSDDHGNKTIYVKAPAGAVIRHDATIAAIAEALKTFGDTRQVQHRRADAIGIIADPRFTQELLSQARNHQSPTRTTDNPAQQPAEAGKKPDPGPQPANAGRQARFAQRPAEAGTKADSDEQPANAGTGSGAGWRLAKAACDGDDQGDRLGDATGRSGVDTGRRRRVGDSGRAAASSPLDTNRGGRSGHSGDAPGPSALDAERRGAAAPPASPQYDGPVASDAELTEDWEFHGEPPLPEGAGPYDPEPASDPFDRRAMGYVPGPRVGPDEGVPMDAADRRALDARLAQIKQDAYGNPASPANSNGQVRPGQTEIFVHLTDLTLATGNGVLRAEGIGPLLAEQLAEVVGHGPYTVKPVIDLNDAVSVDAYEIPTRIRERVRLTYPVELFPYGTRETHRAIDLDHIEPYDPRGTRDQTSTSNLAPLSRYGHRVKTHARGWSVHRISHNTLEWSTPHGFTFRVDPTGTHRVDPTARAL